MDGIGYRSKGSLKRRFYEVLPTLSVAQLDFAWEMIRDAQAEELLTEALGADWQWPGDLAGNSEQTKEGR